jgi:formylglycine-generating enzyme required for sulfatase activity/CRP-like cAMP-binding protein/chromosome segregation ATPase
MSAATKRAVKKSLQELVPLNALSDKSFAEIARKIAIEEVRSGSYLFHKGDHDHQSVYLLDGKIDLIDGHRKVTGEIEAGTNISRYPVANQQPRPLSARASTKVVVARIDSLLLDAYLNWDHTSVAEVTEINADDNEDWMTRILQSDAFSRIPPAIIQRLIISMQPFPVRAGDVVIRQGDEGDFFYSIHKGRCAVTRRDTPDGEEVLLSELSAGDFFGEESLLSASKRNANIIMLTDGSLMRLPKKEFIELLQKPLVKSISYKQAVSMVEEGAVWLDVRSAEEYEVNAFEDCVNIPLSELREQIPELVFNAKYIICCDTGHRSTSAAFILSHKGFDAYVLDGGLNALGPGGGSQAQPSRAVASRSGGPQSAEIIAFNQNDEEDSGDGSEPESVTGSRSPAPEPADELEALRAEVDSLPQADRLRKETKNRLADYKAQLGRLQQAADEADRQASDLQAQLEVAQRERHRLQEHYSRLQKDQAETSGRLEREKAELAAQVKSLRAELATGDEAGRRLRLRTETVEREREAQAAKLVNEIARVAQQRDSLQAELAAVYERSARLEEDYGALREERYRLEENSRAELAQAKQRTESLRAELTQARQHNGSSEANQREHLRTIEALHGEQEGFRQRVSELESELGSLRDQKQALEEGTKAELAKRHEELERLRDELSAARRHSEELTGRIASEEETARQERRQLEEVVASHEKEKAEIRHQVAQLRQELDAALAQKQAQGNHIESLDGDNEALRAERERLQAHYSEQLQQVEQLAAARQAADEALARLQEEWNVERGAMQGEVEAGRQQLAELQARLEQSGEDAGRERLQLQEELQSRIEAYREQLEQQQRREAELQQEQARVAEALESLSGERDSLQARLDESLHESAARQARIDELDVLVASLKNAADSEVKALGEQLERERTRSDEAEARIGEHVSRVESLRAELSDQKECNAGLQVDIEALQRLVEDLREELHQGEARSRDSDQQNQETLRKAYEDLTRKNETEKELQGQIERLRKKLEQSEEALQAARRDERESVENVRNELNAERRARSEERAEMAARQRELKEQLISIASQHEDVIASHDGVVAQARDAGREEERIRLSHIIALQQQTEQQLAELQDELRRAHEETAAAVRRERDSHEADLALARRQKADADAALDQVETQLKQLMQERDAALQGQQALHEQLNDLRAEGEAARRRVTKQHQALAEDPARLIADLKEARRNAKIAARLRAEAEAQRDQAIAQLESASGGTAGRGSSDSQPRAGIGTMASVSTQDTFGKGGKDRGARNSESAASAAVPAGVSNKTGRVRWGRVAAIMLGMASLAALVFWALPRMEIPLMRKHEDAAGAPAVREMTAAGSRVPRAVTAGPNPASQTASTQPSRQVPAAVRDTVPVTTPAKAGNPEIAPVRSFRDELSGGGSGPLMVELPAASYSMGSAGNSLNFEERPQHVVSLPAFAIGKYEVTFAEYDLFAGATGRRLPDDEGWGRNDRPVINVSWDDAQAYTRWLSAKTGHDYRLPSESEWEFAARGGTTTMYWWEGLTRRNPANCFDCGSGWDGNSTAPVGSFQANGFGIHDTAGNVEEWTEDCYHASYEGAPTDGSAWQMRGCSQRVVRGGSYTSPLDSLRSAKRGQYDHDTRLDTVGFRVVRVK